MTSLNTKPMTRSERLAKEGKVEAYIGNLVIAKVITSAELSSRASELEYISTDFDARYNGRFSSVNVYEDINGNYFATID